MKPILFCSATLLAFGALAAQSSAHAQTTSGPSTSSSSGSASSSGRDGMSLLPFTRRGYVGINLGRPDYKLGCVSGYSCNDPNFGFHVYTGGLFNDWIGAEVGYLRFNNADRGGGEVRLEGANASVVVRAPLGQFNVFAKGGVTYGRTRVTADVVSGVTPGRKRGWGGSFGAGVGYDFTPNHGAVIEWTRHDFEYPDGDRRDADMISGGYVYRF